MHWISNIPNNVYFFFFFWFVTKISPLSFSVKFYNRYYVCYEMIVGNLMPYYYCTDFSVSILISKVHITVHKCVPISALYVLNMDAILFLYSGNRLLVEIHSDCLLITRLLELFSVSDRKLTNPLVIKITQVIHSLGCIILTI